MSVCVFMSGRREGVVMGVVCVREVGLRVLRVKGVCGGMAL